MTAYIQPVLGLIVLVAIAWLLSENRRRASIRIVLIGVAIQLAFAAVALSVPVVREAISAVNGIVLALDAATRAGTSLVFGFLGGGDLPFQESFPGASFVLAFRALPIVLVLSALSAVLWHWGVMPRVIRGFALALRSTLRIDGPVSVGAAANIFVGMVEAAILIRPHLRSMSRADLFVTMTCGLTTIAGTVLVLYATFLANVIENAAGHLLVASLISAPAAIVIARLMIPAAESGDAPVSSRMAVDDALASGKGMYDGTMDALVQGTQDGLRLLLSIIAMLIVFVAMVALVNQVLGLAPDVWGAPLTLERMLGWALAPIAWLIGIPWSEATIAGGLIGTKIVLNELIAYLQLSGAPADTLSDRSRIILLYALCSFANFGSVGIMLAGMVAMAPERKSELIELGLKALVAGTIATCMTGAVVGLIV
ncbi:MAG: nucleoside:proton symporter [Alphaproteobacteria bacterium]|nr:nucleoside:proton symporter [Alphaproteobacteria bacterium]